MPSEEPETMPDRPNLVLAMDTSGDICSIAILRGGALMAEHAFRHEMHLSERLIGNVDGLLRGMGATLDSIEAFAVGLGPGSFTGARIGVMTMKTFAVMRGKPIMTVNGLEAMAAEYCGLPETIVVPVLACRAGIVYACPYLVADQDPEPLAAAAAFSFAELGSLLQSLSARTVVFCGPAAARYTQELRGVLENSGRQSSFGTVEFPRASTVGRLGLRRLATGGPLPEALEIVPLYISPPPITLPKQLIPS